MDLNHTRLPVPPSEHIFHFARLERRVKQNHNITAISRFATLKTTFFAKKQVVFAPERISTPFRLRTEEQKKWWVDRGSNPGPPP